MDIDFLSGIVHAQLTRPIFEHDPPMPKLWKTAEKELNYRSSTRELGNIDPAIQIVHEQFHVELIIWPRALVYTPFAADRAPFSERQARIPGADSGVWSAKSERFATRHAESP